MKDDWENIFAAVISTILAAVIASPVYNTIAEKFDLPSLGFWTILGAIAVIRYLFKN